MTEKSKRILSSLFWSAAIAAAFVCLFYTFCFWLFALGAFIFLYVFLLAVGAASFGVLYLLFRRRGFRIALTVFLLLSLLSLLVTFLFLWTGWCGFHFPP